MFGKNSILKRLTGRSGLAAATFALATALTGTNASAEVTIRIASEIVEIKGSPTFQVGSLRSSLPAIR